MVDTEQRPSGRIARARSLAEVNDGRIEMLTWGTELLSTCDEAASVVTVRLATVSGAWARAARMGIALVERRARENISTRRLQDVM